MKALVLDAERKTAGLREVPVPTPQPDELLILVNTIALNPIDSLYVANPLGSTGRTIGSDFAGTIACSGDSVPLSSGLSSGQRVAGFLQGACSVNERPGAFAEYLLCPADLVWRVPDHMSLEEAATTSLCGLTAAQALFYRLHLEAPFEWPEAQKTKPKSNLDGIEETLYFFIYGASTSVGMYAAQLVRRSAESSGKNIQLLGAASTKSFKILEAEPYEYDFLVDYRDQDWPDQIRKFTDGHGVHYAYDCISEGSTVKNTSATLESNGRMAIVRSRQGGAWTANDLPVEPVYGAVWEGLGVDVQYQGLSLPASPEARAFAVAFYKWLSNGGNLQPNTVRLMPGGLERVVEDGLVLLGPGSMGDREHHRSEPWMKPVSAEKLVYRVT